MRRIHVVEIALSLQVLELLIQPGPDLIWRRKWRGAASGRIAPEFAGPGINVLKQMPVNRLKARAIDSQGGLGQSLLVAFGDQASFGRLKDDGVADVQRVYENVCARVVMPFVFPLLDGRTAKGIGHSAAWASRSFSMK